MSVIQNLARAALAGELASLQEDIQQRDDTLQFFEERLAELELALEDQGWLRLGQDNGREFSREGLAKIIALSRLAFKNPLINRAVTLQSFYVFGQGVAISAKDDAINEVVQAFLDDEKNKTELTSHQARTMKEQELQTTGNLFFVCFTHRVTGRVRVRTIDVEEVTDIICDPDDRRSPWFYVRRWQERIFDPNTGKTSTRDRTAYYPDWKYKPQFRPAQIDQQPVYWESPVYHVRVGGFSNMRFGVPETYQALDWAKAYKEFLENWATIVKAYARFAWKMNVTGGKGAVAEAKTKIGTTITNSDGLERNPPATTAAVMVQSGGANLEPVRTAGATTSADDGRHLKLMVAAAVGMPETFFGDADVGNLATSKTLDRPTELKFRDRQTLWADIHRAILDYAVEQAAIAPGGAISGRKTMNKEGEPVIEVDVEDRGIDVSYPPILEHDVDAMITAIVKGATLDGQPLAGTIDIRTLVRLVLTTLGADNIDELLDQIAPEDGESLMDQLSQQRAEQAMAIADKARPAPGDEEQDAEESLKAAVRGLREAIAELQEGEAA